MTNSTLFKLKFSYKEESSKTGKIEKRKLEVIAQCNSYGTAEKLALKLMDDYEMEKFEACVYEIVKLKLIVHDILYNDTMVYENELIEGLVEHYFEDEKGGIYLVNVSISNGEENDKEVKVQYCVPAYDTVSAINFVKNRLAKCNYSKEDYSVTNAKLDNATSFFILPDTHKAMMDSKND